MSWPIAAFAAILSGILTGVSYAPYDFHYLSWICFIPVLFVGITSSRPFLNGLTCGFVSNLIVYGSMWKTFSAAGVNHVTILFCWLLLSFLLALYYGVFVWMGNRYPKNYSFPWVLAAVWVTLEYIRTHIMTGFPWTLLSQTQIYQLPLIQLASITGAAGVSFMIIAMNASLLQILITPRKVLSFLSVGIMLGVIVFMGHQRLKRADDPSDSLKIALLQGNIDQYQKWDKAYEASVRERYEGLLTEALKQKPVLVVWPESAVPGWIPNDAFYWKWVRSLAKSSAVHQFIGSITSHGGQDFNALFHLGPEGNLLGEYDKMKLVPYGEYIPYGSFFVRWVPYLGRLGAFGAGQNHVIFNVDSVRFSATVCYEIIFPALVRASAKDADVLVNVTNDGWFLDTGVPEQHLRANIFRAVENGKPLIRAANTGISAVVDAYGDVIERTKMFEETFIVRDVPLPKLKPTIYQQWGEWFSILCCLVSVMAVAFTFKKKVI